MTDQLLAKRARPRRVSAGLDRILTRLSTVRRRLIGLALLRVGLGVAAVLFYLSDYANRQYFWGPNGYITPQIAKHQMSRDLFSLYLVNDSQLWFQLVFHTGLVVAVLFTIYGGRWLTLTHAIFMWSIYNRNQDILEGGDNLARMLLIFMVLVVSNAYFAPGAQTRRRRMSQQHTPSLSALTHNLGMFLIIFQVAMVYFVSGYWKIAGTVWQQGVAMYYITRIPQFHMFGAVAELMKNAYLGTAIAYFTILIEIAYPFAILSTRGWVRKLETAALEGLHLGIMAFMGLVPFGIIMIAADSAGLRDSDYQWVARRLAPVLDGVRRRVSVPRRRVVPVPLDAPITALEVAEPIAQASTRPAGRKVSAR